MDEISLDIQNHPETKMELSEKQKETLQQIQNKAERKLEEARMIIPKTTPDGKQQKLEGLEASLNGSYANAFFGRDTLEAAEDVLEFKPEIAKKVIISLASLQGIEKDENLITKTEEEPGKILHEYRPKPADEQSLSYKIFQVLYEQYKQGKHDEVLYYGSIDSTILYINLIADYCRKNNTEGKKLLATQYIRKDGKEATIRDSLHDAVQWLEKTICNSSLGLVEYKADDEENHGSKIKNWIDSDTGMVHKNGDLANFKQPIAAIEIQGYAYDALINTLQLFPDADKDTKERRQLLANKIQDSLKRFWMEDEQYFAMGIDRKKEEPHKPRLIDTPSSNSALLLGTGILDSLPEDDKKKYIEGTVRKIMSDEFLTEVGIRTRAKSYADLVKSQEDPNKILSDYHGSETSWIKQTTDIAKGLRRQGFTRLAKELEIRIINGVLKSNKFPEFFYVDRNGDVNYFPEQRDLPFDPDRKKLLSTNLPLKDQLWSITGVLEILHEWEKDEKNPSRLNSHALPQWKKSLEDEVYSSMPHAMLAIREEIPEAYEKIQYPTFIIEQISETDLQKVTA